MLKILILFTFSFIAFAQVDQNGQTGNKVTYNKSYLYILIGQSNANGYNENTPDKTLYNPNQNQFVFYNPDNTWQVLQQNKNNGGAPYIYLGAKGVEMKLFSTLIKYYKDQNQYLLKYAQGGTALYHGGSVPDWSPSTSNSLYFNFITQYNKAMTAFPGYSTTLGVNIIWIQGEQDATSATYANAYQANLINFIGNLRTAINRPNAKFIIVRQGNMQTSVYGTAPGNTVRAAQQNVAQLVSGCALINADGLPTHDGTHYTNVAQDSLALRIFNYLITQ